MQEKIFVDTNIFIYFLYKVDNNKHNKCVELLRKAEAGNISLWTTEWVIAELIWFLQKMKVSWGETKKIIFEGIFISKGIKVRNRKWLIKIIESCDSGKDFVDSVNVNLALTSKIVMGYSYDKGLDRQKELKRLEP